MDYHATLLPAGCTCLVVVAFLPATVVGFCTLPRYPMPLRTYTLYCPCTHPARCLAAQVLGSPAFTLPAAVLPLRLTCLATPGLGSQRCRITCCRACRTPRTRYAADAVYYYAGLRYLPDCRCCGYHRSWTLRSLRFDLQRCLYLDYGSVRITPSSCVLVATCTHICTVVPVPIYAPTFTLIFPYSAVGLV